MRRRSIGGAAALSLLAGLLTLGAGTSARSQEARREELKIPAPALPQGLKWLNSPPLTMEQLRGKVVLIDFWEYTCVNCIRTFPYLKSWHDKYREKGLVIIGVHTPEFQFAKKEANVAGAAKEFGLAYPLIVDSDHMVWNTYGNRFWPAKYLIDAEGFVRYYHFGEGAYGATEQKIQELLKKANPRVELPAIGEPVRGTDKPGAVCYPVTPELYLGFERGGYSGTLGNREGYRPNTQVLYRDPGKWQDGYVYVSGRWQNGREALISTRATKAPTDYIGIRYHALEVNSVLKPEEGTPVRVWVYQDGKPVAKADAAADIKYDPSGRTYLLVDQPRMYSIIKNAKFGQRTLKLAPDSPGMGIYSFTFVSCEVPKK
jgi:thiol-disulfide isomerase/thioredoxin